MICANPDVAELIFKSIKNHPRSVRCKYCRPYWTYEFKPWTLMGKVVEFFWPAHIIGEDYGSVYGYTDGICPAAAIKMIRRIDDGKC